MLKRLVLIRHGVTDWNQAKRAQGQSDVPLNAEGRAQARRLAERIRAWPIDALYGSDLKRAAETARIVGAAAGLEPVFQPAWREINLGDLEGMSGEVIPRDFTSFLAWVASGHVAPGGESYEELNRRVVDGFERVETEHAGKTIAIVSHGGVLKALIVHLLGLTGLQASLFSLAGNTGLTAFDFHHGHPRLTLLNDVGHLE